MTEHPIDPAGLPGPSIPMDESQSPDQGSIARGIGLTAVLHAAVLIVCCAFALVASGDAMNGLMPFLGIGLFQLLYMGPALLYISKRKQPRTLKGMQIALGITFLLNAACFGVVLVSLSGANFH
ncbi:MAG: hypothetical protein IPJ19_17890 [Planctomycetes bacterium]|nr:hypothetical protein [Planctomycetota bacterium]